jgi:hypothetical protein
VLSPLLLCALAGQVGALADDAVVITSSVSVPEARRPARLLSSFLRDRVFETYGISAGISTAAATRFQIAIRFPAAKDFEIAVTERGAPLGHRGFEGAAFDEASFEAWVFVRSLFEQSLLIELASETPPIQNSTIAASPAPNIEAPPATASATIPSSRSAPGPYSIAGLALGVLDNGFGVGLALQGRMDLGGNVRGTIELGYRQNEQLSTLQLIHLPISAGLGMTIDPSIPIEIGVTGTLDPRIVIGAGTAGLGFGMSAGPYGRVRLPFESIDFVGELALPIALYRQAYTQGSDRVVDPLFGVRVAIGVEYSWL